MLKKKTHEYDDFFYGLVLAKSKSLLKFVNEHKGGSDYARKRIIEAKYNLSKLNPILRGFFVRALHKPNSFRIERDTYLTNSRDVGVELEITDCNSPYGNIQYRIQDQKISMEYGKYNLTTEHNDIIIYCSVYKALTVKKENAAAIDFNIQKRQTISEYMRKYGNEYP